jgi:serine/threonine protein kinase
MGKNVSNDSFANLLENRKLLELGTILNEKYEIIRLINCGGNALIYLALNPRKQEVIIKEIYPLGVEGLIRDGKKITFACEKEVEKERFEYLKERAKREGGLLKTLAGKDGGYNNYIDWVLDSFEDNGTYYYVSDYRNLQPLPNKADLLGALKIILRILEALEPLHKANLLHLDITLGNILQTNMTPDGNPLLKVIDFGSSYWLEDIKNTEYIHPFTRTGDFTAPEVRGEYIDVSKIGFTADVFSVGMIFCHLIGISSPMPRHIINNQELICRDLECSQGINRAAIRLSNEIIIKALQSDPDKRYRDASEMRIAVYEAIKQLERIEVSFLKLRKHNERLFKRWKRDNDKFYAILQENNEYIHMKLKDDIDWYSLSGLLIKLQVKGCPHAIITGDGGMGKTTTCMMLLGMCNGQKKPIVFIPLRDYRAEVRTIKTSVLEAFGTTEEGVYKYLIEQEEIVLLFDGVNEMTYEDKRAFFAELNELINNEYLQILITSRDQNDFNSYTIRNFNKLIFEPIASKFIDKFLEDCALKNKNEQLSTELYNVLGNPMMLKMYAISIKEERKYAYIKDKNFLLSPTTVGEIIWNFLEYQVLESNKYYEDTREIEGLGKVIFRYLLPYIGYQVEYRAYLQSKNERQKQDGVKSISNYDFSLVELKKYIKEYQEYFRENRDEHNDLSELEEVFDFFFQQRYIAKDLMKLCVERYCIIKKNTGGTYSFAHQHFCDIFSVTHIKNQMIVYDKDVFTSRIFPHHISKMLMEILQEHKYEPRS